MHYYKRNLGDYAKKAGRLSMLQHGSYTLLIDACYDREQFPTLDEAIEWTWASKADEVEAVEFVLKRFFTLENDRYVQKRIQEEIVEYHQKAETNKRIATEREAKRKESLGGRERSVNETWMDQNEPPPNHKPLTINQYSLVDSVDELVDPADPYDIPMPANDDERNLRVHAVLVKSSTPVCPQLELIDLYEARLPELAQPRKSLWCDGKNAPAMKARWDWVMTASHETGKRKGERMAITKQDGLDWFDRFFAYVSKSDFLMGRETEFSANLIWLANKANFEKVISGNYENKEKAA